MKIIVMVSVIVAAVVVSRSAQFDVRTLDRMSVCISGHAPASNILSHMSGHICQSTQLEQCRFCPVLAFFFASYEFHRGVRSLPSTVDVAMHDLVFFPRCRLQIHNRKNCNVSVR